jgi:hypothetical protein
VAPGVGPLEGLTGFSLEGSRGVPCMGSPAGVPFKLSL